MEEHESSNNQSNKQNKQTKPKKANITSHSPILDVSGVNESGRVELHFGHVDQRGADLTRHLHAVTSTSGRNNMNNK
jgi:hypothetical protein